VPPDLPPFDAQEVAEELRAHERSSARRRRNVIVRASVKAPEAW